MNENPVKQPTAEHPQPEQESWSSAPTEPIPAPSVPAQDILRCAYMELIVTDAGPGLPEGFDFRQGKTLGTRLVFSLARQARAQVQFDVDRGTRVIVRCPMARRQEAGPPPPP